jgi:hypothetical protein
MWLYDWSRRGCFRIKTGYCPNPDKSPRRCQRRSTRRDVGSGSWFGAQLTPPHSLRASTYLTAAGQTLWQRSIQRHRYARAAALVGASLGAAERRERMWVGQYRLAPLRRRVLDQKQGFGEGRKVQSAVRITGLKFAQPEKALAEIHNDLGPAKWRWPLFSQLLVFTGVLYTIHGTLGFEPQGTT